MKQKLLPALSILLICLLATSCVKDAPIYPNDPDFVPYKGAVSLTKSTEKILKRQSTPDTISIKSDTEIVFTKKP